MNKQLNKSVRRDRRRTGIRKRIVGMPERPRLSVYKSLNHIYAQLVDDMGGHTIAAASTVEADVKSAGKTGNAKAAATVGAKLAERAKAKGVSKVVFDRSGFRFHGRIKALADAARKAGLQF